ncbi:MAG TPA: response regulator [Gemmatimonadales bacterium]|jgi:DNA-binding response OmpR family regulator|nr:response regulator [Gemmatimonadales bacterium]
MAKLLLVIDDGPEQRRFLERTLSAAGYRVVTAPDGEAGTAAAHSLLPDLIILDVMMPGMNGYQVCRALKADPATRDRPILVLTAKEEPTDQFWAREVGADDFLSKPVDLPELLGRITELTERR